MAVQAPYCIARIPSRLCRTSRWPLCGLRAPGTIPDRPAGPVVPDPNRSVDASLNVSRVGGSAGTTFLSLLILNCSMKNSANYLTAVHLFDVSLLLSENKTSLVCPVVFAQKSALETNPAFFLQRHYPYPQIQLTFLNQGKKSNYNSVHLFFSSNFNPILFPADMVCGSDQH